MQATIQQLFDECIIASYDCEANNPGKPDFIPGSTMAIGAVSAHWSKQYAPYAMGGRTFFFTMKPEVPNSPVTDNFWAQNAQAREWSTDHSTPIADAFWHFAKWLLNLHESTTLPIVLIAQPHDYDSQHVEHGFNLRSDAEVLRKLSPNLFFADAAELYAVKHNLPFREGKTEFKELFMPKNLAHEPVLDSMVQLSATIAGLIYQRPN